MNAAVRVVAGGARAAGAAGRRRGGAAARAALTLTSKASARLASLLAEERSKNPAVNGFRLGVRTKGCNGMAYTLDFNDKPWSRFDEVVRQDSVALVIEPSALLSVIGTEMDYNEDPLASEFVFINPNASSTCGCGQSFQV